ncbi:hypothetical protein ASE61_08400 [Bosea sp. Root670]|jgi:hypothetical protein|uniref:Soluble ligand binding domain-containing protein n=1 Tax=Bosea robiniae TaxID=1036780 RepID=A0ABY0P666_9HYPH|nr:MULTISPECIES: hypothetical protein [Bosea]KRE03659.1 hypothetical protein ASE61_08400 [Bosea sp. Root670]SDH38935.1 hypothetical protein SAMN05421844_108169 [Bosea robiniae]
MKSAVVVVASVFVLELFALRPAYAGFLDFLLGPPPRTETPYVSTPLEMTIRAKRRSAKAPKKVQVERPPVLVTPMDPVKDPNWFLSDPTLRKGDVVVLPGKIVVFNGNRGERRRSDFEDLLRTRLVSLKERSRIRAFTDYFNGAVRAFKAGAATALQVERPARQTAPGEVRIVSTVKN